MTDEIRMTWADPRAALVHSVLLDLSCFYFPPWMRAQVDKQPMDVQHLGLRALCGEALPRPHVRLYPDEPVTCEACLAADSGPALVMADVILADARTTARTVGVS